MAIRLGFNNVPEFIFNKIFIDTIKFNHNIYTNVIYLNAT